MTIIEQIKDFVKSQLEDNKRLSKENSIFAACGSEDETILRFLDTLESETPINHNIELNDEIYKEKAKIASLIGGVTGVQDKALVDFARHFAEWGAEHLKK